MSEALHFIGIGGIGMSALARLALARGVAVSGSSDKESRLTRLLQQEGARVTIGHRPENITGRPRVVVTSAVSEENPELQAARVQGLDVLSRGALLAELFNGSRGIAVAGTHGKTTVTAMTAGILEAAGFDPTVAVGGERRETGTNFRRGAGEWFVTESDESDGSFLALAPTIAVVTNIENDHVANDTEFAELHEQFRTFLARLAPNGIAVIGIDNQASAALARLDRSQQTVTFGFSSQARIRAADVRYAGFGSQCVVYDGEQRLGDLCMSVPGAINLDNALAAVAVAQSLKIPFAVTAQALASFQGVHRRFDILTSAKRMVVVDDYAHHPSAVAATVAAAKSAHAGNVLVVFQPHRYTRTAYLAADFAAALRAADEVILTELYAASEPPITGISERSIGERVIQAGGSVRYVPRAQLVAHLLQHVPDGSLVLMLGAGDITAAAHELAAAVTKNSRVPAVALAAYE